MVIRYGFCVTRFGQRHPEVIPYFRLVSFPLCRARKTTHEHQHELQHGWESKSKIFCLARKCFFSSSIVSRKGVAAA